MVKYFFFIFSATLVLAGCNCLPDGNPPKGTIVDAPDIPQTYSVAAAENYMATALSTAFLQEFTPGKMILLKAEFSSVDKKLEYMPNHTLKNMRDMFSVVFTKSAKYRLVSKIAAISGKSKTFRWDMEFFKEKELLWKDSVTVVMENR